MKALVILLILPLLAAAQSREPPLGQGVEVYGVVDAGVVLERGCKNDCARSRLSPGIAEGSRIGISGREPLGNTGTSAVFTTNPPRSATPATTTPEPSAPPEPSEESHG